MVNFRLGRNKNGIKQAVVTIILSVLVAGCSVINFSANYYTPPDDFPVELVKLWDGLKAQIKLKYKYDIRIVDGKDSNRVNGIPFLSNRTVFFPSDFIAYVYQNYYNDRAVIFTCVMVHEICHAEFNLPSAPVDEHFKTDVAAIKLLGDTPPVAENVYRALFVVKNYWFARKGMAGHALNVGVNALSGASMALGGPGVFVNLYATDLNRRMSLIAKNYKLKSTACFKRSSQN